MEPLDIILAGREAAGCDDDLPLASEGQAAKEIEEYEEILCFRISDEIYGINILELKEIIKPRETTEVPRTPPFIMGVVSLRGVIIPVFNMRERLGLSQGVQNGRERIVIVKRQEGFTGLLVDEVIQVVRIGKECREPAPAVLEGIDRDFVSGIGRTGAMMIILLNVASITDINLY
jgi:purine-binding chemotaxis protein CheW